MLSVIDLTLVNIGTVSASRPVVRINFLNKSVLGPEGEGGEWRYENFVQDGYYDTMTWYGDDVVVHPGLEFNLPPISFGLQVDTAITEWWSVSVKWACEGSLSSEQNFKFQFPSAR
jgi:hypothetical protein